MLICAKNRKILIYEKYVNTLLEIIYELIIQLDCKVSTLEHSADKSVNLTSATIEVDLKKENPEDTAMAAMDLTDKMFINRLDNKNEPNDEPDNLRHHHNSNDLQSTCPKYQHVEVNDLKIKNEAIKEESKRINDGNQESFTDIYEGSAKKENMDLEVQAILEEKSARIKYLEEKNIKNENKIKEYKKQIHNVQKCNISDMEALVFEIADKHDYIAHLRSKIIKLEEKLEQYERKVQFREKIIRELRRITKNQQQNISPIMMMTPPRTPELKQSRSSADLIESNIMYRNNYLTVPAHKINNIAKGDSFYSLSDIDQDSMVGKSMSEVNFDCFDDINKDEMERLQQTMTEIESENSCNRLLITKLEDELIMIRKCESRNKHDRNLKTDKLNVLKHKIKKIEGSVFEKSSESPKEAELKLHHSDLAIIEDELKPEFDVLNKLVKLVNSTKTNVDKLIKENVELKSTIDGLKAKLLESQQNSQNLSVDIQKLHNLKLPENHQQEFDSQRDCFKIKNYESDRRFIAQFLSHLLGKEISADIIDLTGGTSSPEISSGNSSLTNGHSSLSDVINEWKHELEERKCELRNKNAKINDLEERLRIKEGEICEIQNDLKTIQIERDKNCQMANQLKSAIQYHNESIQFLKRQNAEMKDELGEARSKFASHRDYYDEMKKRNIELEDENNNMRITISTMRTAIEDLKHGNSCYKKNFQMQTNDIEAVNTLNEQFLKETIQKDEQLNRLRDANLQLRSQVFELNQDILDLLEIVEIQKNKRTLENFKIAQREQQQQIEKEISNRERDINCLKHYRSRCVEIEAEYLEKMASQKMKSDTTIKELESEITALTEQLIQSHTQSTHHEELMKQTAILQNSMQDLESQNDILRKTIESYEARFGELQVNLDTIQFENGSLLMEIENLKSDVCDKNKRISEMTVEQQRIETEHEMLKKSCSCSAKNSPTRTSSTVMQINDLKTKLMNKSLESSKATEALKRKTQQYEKLQKTAFEEKSKLRDECLKSIQIIGELKSKVSLLEMRVKEQNDEVNSSRDKLNQNLARLAAIESELESKSAKLEDLTTREEKWRIHAYEISHEIKNRKEDAFKREQKLMDEIAAKTEQMKDQMRVVLQHENTVHHLRNENEALRESNRTLNHRLNDLKAGSEELREKEKGLSELLEKTEEELKMIKSEVFQLFNTHAVSDIKSVHGQMKTESEDLQTKYQHLLADYNKLVEENRTLCGMKNDTISAIELFKKLQDENLAREKSYKIQIEKLLNDKRSLHKDRTRLTKQLLSKHRDMIILNSEIDKFRHSEDYESRSSSQYNSLQPFQPVMYPSGLAPLARSSSNPDLIGDPMTLDARTLTAKMSHVRKFWQHGIQTAVTSLVNVQQSQAQQIQPPKEAEDKPS
ncbi:putative leucine-rich repeat-containing protein DDB_G0290503 isoform X4 [Chironomus tepperi]|uniref:putative leucine-rich repeat-containing protein DDB_G0290503 isoform X4 n=1 Tax=Chironomus tepperi TaxID=113505 RepID=UPI00391F5286